MLVKTKIKRAIIEMSSMINNDEVFYHFTNDESLEKVLPELKGTFRDPHVRCIRPVFAEEIQQGLDPTQNWTTDMVFDHVEKYDKNPFSDITQALDALYILHQQIDNNLNQLNRSPEDAIISFVAYNFYDCMSGGCSPYSLAMCRYLYEKYEFDLDKEVYPSEKRGNENGWLTMKTFIREIERIPRFETLFPEMLELSERTLDSLLCKPPCIFCQTVLPYHIKERDELKAKSKLTCEEKKRLKYLEGEISYIEANNAC